MRLRRCSLSHAGPWSEDDHFGLRKNVPSKAIQVVAADLTPAAQLHSDWP